MNVRCFLNQTSQTVHAFTGDMEHTAVSLCVGGSQLNPYIIFWKGYRHNMALAMSAI